MIFNFLQKQWKNDEYNLGNYLKDTGKWDDVLPSITKQ